MFYPANLQELIIHPAYVGKDRPHGSKIRKIELWKSPWLCMVLNSVEFVLPNECSDGQEMMKHGYNDFTTCEHPQFWWRDGVLK